MAEIHARAMPPDRPWSAEEIETLLATTGAFPVTAPGGFAIGRTIAGEAELLTLAVDPAHRRQGLGRTLLAGFGQEARKRGADTAFLEVAADNRAAIALYEGADWSQSGRRPRYYARNACAPADALIFVLALSDG